MTFTATPNLEQGVAAEVVGDCTCHNPPRAATFDNGSQEWVHHDDETGAEMFHVHEDTTGRDCDGQLDRSHVHQITSLVWRDHELGRYYGSDGVEHTSEPTGHDLWRKLVRLNIPDGECEARIGAMDDAGHLFRMTWSEPTDEGFSAGQLTGCDDPNCAHERSSQRDYFAEAMGY